MVARRLPGTDNSDAHGIFMARIRDGAELARYGFIVTERLEDPDTCAHLMGALWDVIVEGDRDNDTDLIGKADRKIKDLLWTIATRRERRADLGGRKLGPNAPDVASPLVYLEQCAREECEERGVSL